jgi:signal transduction histidine kinase
MGCFPSGVPLAWRLGSPQFFPMVNGTPGRLRAAFIVLLLLGTLLVAMFLAVQAIATSRYHRSTAEGVLRDYAQLAAGQYAGRASQEVYYNLVNPVIQELARTPAGQFPARSRPDSGAAASALNLVASFIELGPGGELIRAGPDSLAYLGEWIRDTILADVKTIEEGNLFASIVREDARGSYLLVYVPGTPQGSARGFLFPLGVLSAVLREAVHRGPLLPPSLTRGVGYDSLVSIRVTTPGGTDLFHSEPQFPSTFAAWDSTGDYVGRLPVFAALRPDIAEALIIGGLPRSRFPLLVGLLVLTAGLIVAALLLLRREQELARLRAEFVSGVSHELRTPLAQIRMFAETLRLGRVRSPEEQQRSLRIVDQEARRLTHLVENLLYFSRSERQPPRISRATVELGPLVNEVVESFTPLAASRQMEVRVASPDHLLVSLDPDAVRQVLLNLLDNAVKYGQPGQTIGVEAGSSNGTARLSVEDEGPGIPAQERERVWERFWRGERDRHSNVAGTGIGLAIVRELATLHGGKVRIEDGDRGGSRFVVEMGDVLASEGR